MLLKCCKMTLNCPKLVSCVWCRRQQHSAGIEWIGVFYTSISFILLYTICFYGVYDNGYQKLEID